MTDTYPRGYGGYTLNAAQKEELRAILVDVEHSDLTQAGQGVPIYEYLLSLIAPNNTLLAGVGQNVYEWIAGAVGVNSGTSSQGIFIREYTEAAYKERYGTTLSDAQLNALVNTASNCRASISFT